MRGVLVSSAGLGRLAAAHAGGGAFVRRRGAGKVRGDRIRGSAAWTRATTVRGRTIPRAGDGESIGSGGAHWSAGGPKTVARPGGSVADSGVCCCRGDRVDDVTAPNGCGRAEYSEMGCRF